jgi:hypothetical protein
MRYLIVFLLSTGCQFIAQRPADCSDGRINGRETDLDCGGGVCAGCAEGALCLANADCASAVCLLNRCEAPSCDDGVQNGAESAVDCGGACGPCKTPSCIDGGCVEPSCSNQRRDGVETDVDCGGGACSTCAMGQTCSRTADCATGECVDGRCGNRCVAPLLACNNGCVDPRIDSANCGRCGAACAPDRICAQGQCTLVCLGGTQLCSNACVDSASNPAHCGGCNMPCASGSVCVGGMCVTACQMPLLSCQSGALCVDPRVDPNHCGMCNQPCPPPPQAAPACVNATCIIGACQPGFEDCNGSIADGCEAALLSSQMHCGGCNQPCGPMESCQLGQCCGPLPMGSYQASCSECVACGGFLRCMCNDMMMIPRPAQTPLNPPCPFPGLRNCNGNLLCGVPC